MSKIKTVRPLTFYQGFLKNPFYYLGVISIILLGLIVLNGGAFLKSLNLKNLSLAPEQNLFFSQNKKIWPESPDFLLIQKSSLKGITPPFMVTAQVLGSLIEPNSAPSEEITEYIVEPGDSLWQIAEKFGISLNTILWANNLSQYSKIQPGQKLIILPVSGVIHHIQAGDTVSGIAQKYKVKSDEIISFNNLSSEADIFIGDILIVPGGVMPSLPSQQYVVPQVPIASSYFICPIAPPCRITQGLHWYNAIDFSHQGVSCGEPIYAAAGGQIQKTGYSKTLGNYVRILHLNGVVTLYGHLQNILVSSGQEVSQGQTIGLMGYSGYTIPAGPAGCHLHFEVRGAKNPFAR